MAYKNGYWPDYALVTVQGSGANAIRLSAPTAAILRRMRADAGKEGVTITLVSSYHGAAGYRSWPTQLDMRAHPSLYDITPGIISGLPSGHGDANCMDIDGGLAWVKANGAKYGVTFPISFDHNHARYDGIAFAGEIGSPITADAPPPSRTDTDMRFARVTLNASGNHYMGYLIGPNGIIDPPIDNQEGWDGKTAFADNAIYARLETMWGAGLNRADYTFTPDQWTAMQAWIGGWAKPAGGVTNVTVDNTTVLDAIKNIPAAPTEFVAK